MRRLLIAALLLSGCAAERFSVHGRSCDENFTTWSGGLTFHLLKGNRRAGTWGYDPKGLEQARNQGAYDFETGDFSWTVSYHPDHWRVRTEVEGYGYAKPDGDLDVLYTVTTEDENDEEFGYEVREERTGCEVQRRLNGSDWTAWHTGEYTGGVYAYEQDYDGQVVEGTLRKDGTWTESYESSDYAYDTTGDADGWSRREWWEEGNDYELDGVVESFLDGSRHIRAEYDDGTWYEYTVDYDGDGDGTYAYEGGECDLQFEAGACSIDCGDGWEGC